MKTYKAMYIHDMKQVQFIATVLGNSRDFPDSAMRDVGYQLDYVQRGL